MKRRLFALLLLPLLFACSGRQEAAVTETPAPTDAPVITEAPASEEVSFVTPDADTVAWETPEPPALPPVPTPSPTPEPTPTPKPLAGITIGLDPGHQQRANHNTEPIAPDGSEYKAKCSSGTRGVASGVYEYEVNLNVALKLKALLEEAGATVVITRTANNVNISNAERAEMFNEREVDLAIRLHCNGTDDTSVRGAFMLVPTKERTAYFNENVRAASAILEQYCAETGIEPRKRNGITYRSDQAGFNWCTRPIVCIEMGHLSNETEDLLLTNDSFQDKMAFGIYCGILACFGPDSALEGGNS